MAGGTGARAVQWEKNSGNPLDFLRQLAYFTPAMMRILILVVGLIWASLLLISWGGSVEAQPSPATTVVTSQAS